MSEERIRSLRYGDRPALWVLVACLIGWLLAYHHLLLSGGLILGLLLVGTFLLSRRRGWGLDRFFLLLPLFVIAYGVYADQRFQSLRTMPRSVTLRDASVRVNYPVASSAESAIRYDAALLVEEGKEIPFLLTLPGVSDELYGVMLRGDLDLVALLGDTLPGSYGRYLLGEGYVAQAYGQSLETAGRARTIRCRLMEGRHRLISRFDAAVGNRLSSEDKGLVYALCLGERLHLPRSVKSDFTSSGVAHVLAVSGYHLGIVFGLLSGLLGLLLPAYRHRRLRYLLILLGLLLYTLLTGASTATVRAFVMSGIYLLAKLLGRRADPVQVLSLTLLFFLFLSPLSILGVGLILSVSAVWGLMSFMPILLRLVSPSLRSLRFVWSSLAACISAQIGVLPCLFLFFGKAAGSMLWSAIPVVALSSLLIPVGLVALALPSLPVLPRLLSLLTGAMRAVTENFATPALSLTVTMQYDLVLVVLYYAIVLTARELFVRLYNRSRYYSALSD